MWHMLTPMNTETLVIKSGFLHTHAYACKCIN